MFSWIGGGGPNIQYLVPIISLLFCLIIVVIFDSENVIIAALLIVGCFSLMFGGEYCDLSGFIFIGYALVLSKNKYLFICAATFNYLAIGVKYMLIGGPVSRVLLDIVGFTFVYLVGYVIYKRIFNEQSR